MLYQPQQIDFGTSVLVFVHIPKTAGTSLIELLSEAAGEGAHWRLRSQKLERPFRTEFERDVMKLRHRVYGWASRLRGHHWLLPKDASLGDASAIRFISGHVGLGNAPDTGKTPVYVSLVRDPVDRFLSEYFFYHDLVVREGVSRHDRQPARKMDLDAYVERISIGRIARPMNSQCLYLCGHETYAAAKEAVDTKLFLIAPVARIDSFVAMLGRAAGFERPPIPTANRGMTRASRSREVAPHTLAAIERLVAEDRKLFNYVSAEFDSCAASHGVAPTASPKS